MAVHCFRFGASCRYQQCATLLFAALNEQIIGPASPPFLISLSKVSFVHLTGHRSIGWHADTARCSRVIGIWISLMPKDKLRATDRSHPRPSGTQIARFSPSIWPMSLRLARERRHERLPRRGGCAAKNAEYLYRPLRARSERPRCGYAAQKTRNFMARHVSSMPWKDGY
jgi:hypothetical protein